MDTAYRLRTPVSTLWRAAGELQVGLDAEASVLLPEAPRCADRVVHAFDAWRTPADVLRLVPGIEAGWLADAVTALVGAGALIAGPPRPGTSCPVVVIGSGALARHVVRLLGAGGVPVLRVVDDTDADPLALRRRWQELSGPTTQVGLFGQWHTALDDPVRLVVVAPATVEADRVLTDHLRRAGVPHLMVRAEPERAVVGPFVVPGGGACLRCVDLTRRDLDPEWPLLLSQLARTLHSPGPVASAWAASTAAAEALAWLGRGRAGTCGATLELVTDTLAFETRTWAAHPACGCVQPW